MEDLRSADWWVRDDAIRGLLQHPEERYLIFLEEALKDHENANLRNASMECYVKLGARSLSSLQRLILDEDHEVRLFAANMLGDIGDKKASPDLIGAMTDPDGNVRMAAAEALGKIGDPEAVGVLEGSLEDEPWVAMAAIKALGEIGGDGALRVLYKCLEKEDYRGITFDAIERAGNENAIRYLTPFVDADEMKELALRAVVNIADRRRLKLRPEYFINMVPLVLELQHSADPEVKKAAFIALSWAEDLRGLPFLIEALDDEELQEYALSGILGIGERAVPEIIEALRDTRRPHRNILAKLLFMSGEYASLIRFFDDDDPEVRVEVALALGKTGSAKTAEILSRMLDDPDEEVRTAARKISRIAER